MALSQHLTDVLTKERGGRHGGKGHEFHRYWALCHLLTLDLEQPDYLLLVEFIEDIAVFDSEEDPTKTDLFQLKKKDGGSKWTKNTLSRPLKEGLSILAKLFESKKLVPEGDTTIAFVSNTPISLPLWNDLDSTGRNEFAASELTGSLKKELQSALAKELNCAPCDIELDSLRFIKSSLALDDLENHACGRVVSYLAEKFPEHSARADVFCKALYGELTVRATCTTEAASFDELRKLRGIGKSQMQQMLATTISRKSDTEIIDTVLSTLAAEMVPIKERLAVRDAARRYLVDKTARNNNALAALEQLISTHLQNVPDDFTTTWQVANWVFAQLEGSPDWHSFVKLEKPYVLATALYWINR